jgi:iron complex transport system ATP-binding protein
MASTPAVSLNDVTVTRNGRNIVDHISLDFGGGERWALIGPNGSGKSTVLKMASSWLHPTSGTINIFGRELGTFDVTEIRKVIGFVTPAHDLQWPLDGLDVVLTGITGTLETPMRWQPSAEEVSRARAAMREVGVEQLASTQWYVMSQGERGRVLIARALILKPRLLILDEPMTGLDLTAREQLLDTLDDLAGAEPGLTSVLVTHHIDELPASTTHAALMSQGRIISEGAATDVLTSVNVSTAFEHPIEVSYDRGRWAARSAR